MTTRNYTLLFMILLPFLLSACIDPFDVASEVNGTSLLVVDGMITNQHGPYQVSLRYSSTSLKGYEDSNVAGARVSITDGEGSEEILHLTASGVYETDSSGMQGQIGSTYQLHVMMPDGKRYASQPETLQPLSPIDSIYAELESKAYLNIFNEEVQEWGMQIYLNTGSGTPDKRFYRWDWLDTYELMTPMPLPLSSAPLSCWKTGHAVRYLNISNTQILTKDIIEKQPITFISKKTKKLNVRYSILITQYGLTRNAYDYWEKIQEQSESAGSVFDPPPAQIIGNLYNEDNDNELVLGYFQASSVTEKRFFIERREIPDQPGGPPAGFSDCQPGFPDLPAYCADCSLWPGSTTVKPSYW